MAKFFVKIALLTGLAGLVLLIIGLVTPYWVVTSGSHNGLWKYCHLQTNGTSTVCDWLEMFASYDSKVWAPRILNVLACVASFFSLLLLLIYLRRNDGTANLRRIKAVTILCVVCALLVFVGIAVYASHKHGHHQLSAYHYGWSFIVTILAAGLHLLLILGLCMEMRTAATLGAYESI